MKPSKCSTKALTTSKYSSNKADNSMKCPTVCTANSTDPIKNRCVCIKCTYKVECALKVAEVEISRHKLKRLIQKTNTNANNKVDCTAKPSSKKSRCCKKTTKACVKPNVCDSSPAKRCVKQSTCIPDNTICTLPCGKMCRIVNGKLVNIKIEEPCQPVLKTTCKSQPAPPPPPPFPSISNNCDSPCSKKKRKCTVKKNKCRTKCSESIKSKPKRNCSIKSAGLQCTTNIVPTKCSRKQSRKRCRTKTTPANMKCKRKSLDNECISTPTECTTKSTSKPCKSAKKVCRSKKIKCKVRSKHTSKSICSESFEYETPCKKVCTKKKGKRSICKSQKPSKKRCNNLSKKGKKKTRTCSLPMCLRRKKNGSISACRKRSQKKCQPYKGDEFKGLLSNVQRGLKCANKALSDLEKGERKPICCSINSPKKSEMKLKNNSTKASKAELLCSNKKEMKEPTDEEIENCDQDVLPCGLDILTDTPSILAMKKESRLKCIKENRQTDKVKSHASSIASYFIDNEDETVENVEQNDESINNNNTLNTKPSIFRRIYSKIGGNVEPTL